MSRLIESNLAGRARRLPLADRIAALSASVAIAQGSPLDQVAAELASAGVEALQGAAGGLLGRVLRRGGGERLAFEAAAGLAARWGFLRDEVREAVAVLAQERWIELVGRLVSSPDAQVRRGGGALALDRGGVAELLAASELIADAEPEVARAGGKVLGALAELAAADPAAPWAAGVEQAVAAALLDGRGHALRECIAGASALLSPARTGPETVLGAWLWGPDGAGHTALAAWLRGDDGVRSCERAMELLAHPGLRGAACDRLSRASSVAEHATVLGRWHLLSAPKRREAALAGRESGRGIALPSAGAIAALPTEARRGLARTIEVLGEPAPVRAQIADALLGDNDAGVRLAAMRACPSRSAADWVFDDDEGVARGAVLRLTEAGEPGATRSHTAAGWADGLWPVLLRSPHAAVREIALQECVLLDWLDAASAGGRLLARRMLAEDRDGTLAAFRDHWRQCGANAKLVAWVRAMGVENELAELLTEAAGAETDRRVNASAVSALAGVTGAARESATEAVRRSLRDADARVRSNGAEGLARTVGDGASKDLDLVWEMKADPHHRVKSSAVAAWLSARSAGGRAGGREGQDAARLSADLLCDGAEPSRLAGAWLVERILGLSERAVGRRWRTELAVLAEESAQGDPSERVRRRAGFAAARGRDALIERGVAA